MARGNAAVCQEGRLDGTNLHTAYFNRTCSLLTVPDALQCCMAFHGSELRVVCLPGRTVACCLAGPDSSYHVSVLYTAVIDAPWRVT